ncbi:MAG: hypothetical protein AB2693_27670, partial [Candidatus Thiodiazotropha sp.]
LLHWLAMNFMLFISHPSTSNASFTHNLQIQKMTHNDTQNILPSSYHDARKLIDPYVVQKQKFDVCINECVIFWQSALGTDRSNDFSCPVCGEDRYQNSKSKRPVARRRFIYIPVGPRLARLYGDVNLAQLVMSHPGCEYRQEHMWDIHHSPIWRDLYSKDGYFGGDKMGISLALELDGVNPFHNIGVMYSMTPIMITILNLPRHIRNVFQNIYLVGIIPGSGKSESANLSPYLEILVDELLFLTQCKTYSAYANAPVEIKLKLLLYVLDYPGLSKLFNQHGSGGLCGCHWCYVRGEYNKHLEKVIYLSNRSYLPKENLLRRDDTLFLDKSADFSTKPKLRAANDESSYRLAYEQAKNKTHAQLVASATGCKANYVMSNLPGHNRVNESVPDCCHTVKDVVQNIMKLLTGNSINLKKIVEAEKKMGRLQCLEVSKDDQPQSKKQKLSKKEPEQVRLAFVLTPEELKTADKCAESITVPLGFGIKPGKFISKTGSLKSHDWKQLATQGFEILPERYFNKTLQRNTIQSSKQYNRTLSGSNFR